MKKKLDGGVFCRAHAGSFLYAHDGVQEGGSASRADAARRRRRHRGRRLRMRRLRRMGYRVLIVNEDGQAHIVARAI